ncbi:hypothetical protein [Flagellimonas beolgyonensis]|uniref:hypothetical protein n=1 Tax=Flagellimonas beolgyonensis TaxID=864064 RepID=UPI000F8E1527|nr:hypothetical protein [Allomuricauda beolgyonensis]
MNLFGGSSKGGNKSRFKEVFNKHFFANLFYGFKHWFRTYDTLVFTNDQYRKIMNGAYFDRVIDPFINEGEQDRTLFISLTEGAFRPTHMIHSKHIVSQTILDLLGFFTVKCQLIFPDKYSHLQTILNKYNIEFDVLKEMKQFQGYYKFYRFFFKLRRPKRIFVATYYSATRNYMVKAANDSGIKVIEGQHGFVGDAHPSYNSEISLDASYFPAEFWVFSSIDKKALQRRGIYQQHQIKIKGDYFLDCLKKEGKKNNSSLEVFTKNYNNVVGVSLQVPLEDKYIPFIVRSANLDKEVGYVIIPRTWDEKYGKIKHSGNVLFLRNCGFYEAIFWCTHHSTVFSTTALEAQYLGIPNILVDIDGFATKYFGSLFPVKSIIEREEDFVKMIKS